MEKSDLGLQCFACVRYLNDVDNEMAAIGVSEKTSRLERLYLEHVPRATRLAFLLTGDREQARDLAHDAFIRTSRRIHTLRDPDAFGAYMIRTAINMSKRHRWRSELERRHLERESANVSSDVSPPDFESADEVISSLRALPHRQRAALVLRFYVDLADADIAEIMGTPVGTVRSLISRGLAGLRKQLGEQDA